MDEYKADDHCWLNVKTDTIWAFVGPVIFVLAVCNLIFPPPPNIDCNMFLIAGGAMKQCFDE